MTRQTLEERYREETAQQMITMANRLPGLPQYLGITLQRFEPGRLWARADFSEQITTPSGNVHGGAVAAVLDHITGAVIYPLIPDGHWGATTELKLNYIAPVRPAVLEAQAMVLAITNRSAVVRGEAYLDDQLVAAAQGTITIVAPRPAAT